MHANYTRVCTCVCVCVYVCTHSIPATFETTHRNQDIHKTYWKHNSKTKLELLSSGLDVFHGSTAGLKRQKSSPYTNTSHLIWTTPLAWYGGWLVPSNLSSEHLVMGVFHDQWSLWLVGRPLHVPQCHNILVSSKTDTYACIPLYRGGSLPYSK